MRRALLVKQREQHDSVKRTESMNQLQPVTNEKVNREADNATGQIVGQLLSHFQSDLKDKTIAVWGLDTESNELSGATLFFVDWLVSQGATVSLHAPDASADWPQPHVRCCDSHWDALLKADGVITGREMGTILKEINSPWTGNVM